MAVSTWHSIASINVISEQWIWKEWLLHKCRQQHGVCLEVLTDERGKTLRIVSIRADFSSFLLSNSSALLQQPTCSVYFVGEERFWKESPWKTDEGMEGYYENGSLKRTLRNGSQQNKVNSLNSTLSVPLLSSLQNTTM